MVTVGGGVGIRNGDQWQADPEQRQVDLWDPATGTWHSAQLRTKPAPYHSTALLLPDGRVISAGDDANGGIDRDTAEIYEPPYLFKGPRPRITTGPNNIRYGTTVNVGTPDADVTGAALVALGATTHAVDMNQRYIRLNLASRAGGVTLTAPPTPEIATPGYYMLFLLNSKGVPSMARFIRLGSESDPPPPPLDPIASDNCIRDGAAVKGRSLGPRSAGPDPQGSAPEARAQSSGRTLVGNLDRYCVAGPGSRTIGYPSKRALRGLWAALAAAPPWARGAGARPSSPRFSVRRAFAPGRGRSPHAAGSRARGGSRPAGPPGGYVARIRGGRVVVCGRAVEGCSRSESSTRELRQDQQAARRGACPAEGLAASAPTCYSWDRRNFRGTESFVLSARRSTRTGRTGSSTPEKGPGPR